MLKAPPSQDSETRVDDPSEVFEIDHKEKHRLASIMEHVSRALEGGDIGAAERHLRLGLQENPENPKLLSYLSICVASAGRELETAEELAKRITREFPLEPAGHLALGKVKLATNKRRYAFQNFQKARDLARSDEHMIQELDKLEPRRLPVFPFLGRSHFLNIWAGKLRFQLERFFPPTG